MRLASRDRHDLQHHDAAVTDVPGAAGSRRGPVLFHLIIQDGRETMNQTHYRLADDRQHIWEILRADQEGEITASPQKNEQRVVAFQDRALLGAPEKVAS